MATQHKPIKVKCSQSSWRRAAQQAMRKVLIRKQPVHDARDLLFIRRKRLKRQAVLAFSHVLEIAYHLMVEAATYRELGTEYFDRYRAERLMRLSLEQLRRLGYQVMLTQLPTAA